MSPSKKPSAVEQRLNNVLSELRTSSSDVLCSNEWHASFDQLIQWIQTTSPHAVSVDGWQLLFTFLIQVGREYLTWLNQLDQHDQVLVLNQFLHASCLLLVKVPRRDLFEYIHEVLRFYGPLLLATDQGRLFYQKTFITVAKLLIAEGPSQIAWNLQIVQMYSQLQWTPEEVLVHAPRLQSLFMTLKRQQKQSSKTALTVRYVVDGLLPIQDWASALVVQVLQPQHTELYTFLHQHQARYQSSRIDDVHHSVMMAFILLNLDSTKGRAVWTLVWYCKASLQLLHFASAAVVSSRPDTDVTDRALQLSRRVALALAELIKEHLKVNAHTAQVIELRLFLVQHLFQPLNTWILDTYNQQKRVGSEHILGNPSPTTSSLWVSLWKEVTMWMVVVLSAWVENYYDLPSRTIKDIVFQHYQPAEVYHLDSAETDGWISVLNLLASIHFFTKEDFVLTQHRRLLDRIGYVLFKKKPLVWTHFWARSVVEHGSGMQVDFLVLLTQLQQSNGDRSHYLRMMMACEDGKLLQIYLERLLASLSSGVNSEPDYSMETFVSLKGILGMKAQSTLFSILDPSVETSCAGLDAVFTASRFLPPVVLSVFKYIRTNLNKPLLSQANRHVLYPFILRFLENPPNNVPPSWCDRLVVGCVGTLAFLKHSHPCLDVFKRLCCLKLSDEPKVLENRLTLISDLVYAILLHIPSLEDEIWLQFQQWIISNSRRQSSSDFEEQLDRIVKHHILYTMPAIPNETLVSLWKRYLRLLVNLYESKAVTARL